jgi:hypothetical protein
LKEHNKEAEAVAAAGSAVPNVAEPEAKAEQESDRQ